MSKTGEMHKKHAETRLNQLPSIMRVQAETRTFANSGLGEAFRKANKLSNNNDVVLTDFSPYAPSYEAPASFIASPIFDGNKKLGVLIFQMPVDVLNGIMTNQGDWQKVGLGATGETYLVGSDMKMRSQSRGLIEDANTYLKTTNRTFYRFR